MKKYLKIGVFALAITLVATPAFAEVGSVVNVKLDGPASVNARFDVRADMKKDRVEIRDIKEKIDFTREDRRNTERENKAEMDEKFEDRRSDTDALKVKFDSATTPEDKASIKAEFETSRGDFKDDVKTTREENRAEVRAKTAEIQSLRAEAITKVYSAMIERLEKLSLRITSRIEKLVAEGQDMTAVKASLSIASSEIALAKADFAKLSTTTASGEKANKEIIVSMKTHLKLAHEAMVKALGEVKGARTSSVE